MTGILVLVVVAVVFWLLAYTTKRRFGVLGLALASGALLSLMWAGQLVGIVERADISLASISTAGLVSALLVLAPALLLLFSGPSYKSKNARVMGALLFAVFAVVLIAEPLSSLLVLDVQGREVFDLIMQYQPYMVTLGVMIALLDLLAIHTVSGGHEKKGRH